MGLTPDESVTVTAARAGDEVAFGELVERHRRELQVHCYRMLGSFEESEDVVQETFLRAWRRRETFEGRSTFRAWLYRIATNACLDLLARQPRRILPYQLGPASDPSANLPPRPELPWLQPYPDRLLDGIAPDDDEPASAVVARETIELAFLAAIQLLPPRQRAVLILRDVLDWSAKETAALLESSVASANSALQRARATLKQHLPERRLDWTPTSDPSEEERAVLRRYMAALEQADPTAVAALLAEDAQSSMPPHPMWFRGRTTIRTGLENSLNPGGPCYVGHFRMVPTRANRQPAAAAYLRAPGESVYRAFAIDVLRIENAEVVEIVAFGPELFPAFGLPPTL